MTWWMRRTVFPPTTWSPLSADVHRWKGVVHRRQPELQDRLHRSQQYRSKVRLPLKCARRPRAGPIFMARPNPDWPAGNSPNCIV